MCWNTVQTHARKMGFEVALRSRQDGGGGYMPDLTPPGGEGWVFVGNYEHIAGFWVRPVTKSAARLNGNLVRKLMAEGDPFVEAVGDYDADFFAANAPFLSALEHQARSQE